MERKRSVRKLKSKTINGGEEVSHAYCRKCTSVKAINQFYTACDKLLDQNGVMSICKKCISELYEGIYLSEKNVQKTILRLCRILNVRYDEGAVELTLSHLNTLMEKKENPEYTPVFGIYRLKLSNTQSTEIGKRDTTEDLTFREPSAPLEIKEYSPEEISQDVIDFWGEGYSLEEYEWLERTLDSWKKTHKSDTRAEEVLLREIVFKEFGIKNARREGRSESSLVKEFESLIKTAAIDPNKTSLANSGKAMDTFSDFIKMIENNEVAEIWDNPDLYKDFFGTEKYYENYVLRGLKNFVLQSKDFNILDENEQDLEDDMSTEENEK